MLVKQAARLGAMMWRPRSLATCDCRPGLLFGSRGMGTVFRVSAELATRESQSSRGADDAACPNTVVIECGGLARQADGAASVRMGDLVILGTAVQRRYTPGNIVILAGTNIRASYMVEAFYAGRTPLKVDYRERAVAVGRIAATVTRRETSFTDVELRTSALVHRALAPLLRKNLVYDTQVLLTLLASDGVHDPAATCINAASTALLLSQATLDPLAAVRVALVNGEIVVNPTLDETALASAEILYAGNEQGATLINLAAAQASLEDCSMLLRSAHEQVAIVTAAQRKMMASVDGEAWEENGIGDDESEVDRAFVEKMMAFNRPRDNVIPSDELLHQVGLVSLPQIVEVFKHGAASSLSLRERADALWQIEQDAERVLQGSAEHATREMISRCFSSVLGHALVKSFLQSRCRADGRTPFQRRQLQAQACVFPVVHGSSLLDKGDTQVACTVALGATDMATVRNGYVLGEQTQSLIVTWETPPYARKSFTRSFMYGRIEVDRAELLRQALVPTMPDKVKHTVRVHCDVLGYDGSGLMAAVSAASLALMDAGVAVSAPVAGISLALLTSDPLLLEAEHHDSEPRASEPVLVVDATAVEEEHGAMTLHVAGTACGITLASLDLSSGVPISLEQLQGALACAYSAVQEEVVEISAVLSEPRESTRHAGCTVTLPFPAHLRRMLVGVRGATVSRLEAESGCLITLKEDGAVLLGRSPKVVARGAAVVGHAIEELLEKTDSDRSARGEGGMAFQTKEGAHDEAKHRVEIPASLQGKSRAMFIGKGGSAISKLEADSSAKIMLREGHVAVVADNEATLTSAAERVRRRLAELENVTLS